MHRENSPKTDECAIQVTLAGQGNPFLNICSTVFRKKIMVSLLNISTRSSSVSEHFHSKF